MKPKFAHINGNVFGVFRPKGLDYGRNGIRNKLCSVSEIEVIEGKSERDKYLEKLWASKKEEITSNIKEIAKEQREKVKRNNQKRKLEYIDRFSSNNLVAKLQQLNRNIKKELREFTRLQSKKEVNASHDAATTILPVVYFIRERDTDIVKVGVSADYFRRLSDLQTANPNTLIPVGVIRCLNMAQCRFIESYISNKYFDRMTGGGDEWYILSAVESRKIIENFGGDCFL